MSRKKRHAEHANHERWLVSYADFITLLFAFFVVLFASSQVDERKVGKLSKAIEAAFTQMGIFSSSNLPMALPSESMSVAEIPRTDTLGTTSTLGRLISPVKGKTGTQSGLQDLSVLQKELERELAPEILRREVALQAKGESLVLSLREIGFFNSGQATVKPESEAPLSRIGAVLKGRPHGLRIEGHTDNIPIRNQQFASNWELSTARATEIVKKFIVRYGIAPERLSAAGFGEYHPVESNSTAAGQALNRRVDIVILPPPSQPETEAPAAETASAPASSVEAHSVEAPSGEASSIDLPSVKIPLVELPPVTVIGMPSPPPDKAH
ncbi:MAG: OmpA family protein [Acidobacteria bacterium]|nr:OmpA family protein [Acidobacteriota bacterium]MCZ6750608.1 OmpA family protein [Acidobacteriota bacterium]